MHFLYIQTKKGVQNHGTEICTGDPEISHMLHGGDYNPEQWLDQPEVLEEDIRLFRKAHINCVSLGIFSWAKLEPEEGVYDFGWLDEIIDRLYANGIYTVLATPSGARPQWLAQKYPEVLRVRPDGLRNFYGHRQNHCYTSPLYWKRSPASTPGWQNTTPTTRR